MNVQFCGVGCHVDRCTLVVSGNCLSTDAVSYTRRLESSRHSWLHNGTQAEPLPHVNRATANIVIKTSVRTRIPYTFKC